MDHGMKPEDQMDWITSSVDLHWTTLAIQIPTLVAGEVCFDSMAREIQHELTLNTDYRDIEVDVVYDPYRDCWAVMVQFRAQVDVRQEAKALLRGEPGIRDLVRTEMKEIVTEMYKMSSRSFAENTKSLQPW